MLAERTRIFIKDVLVVGATLLLLASAFFVYAVTERYRALTVEHIKFHNALVEFYRAKNDPKQVESRNSSGSGTSSPESSSP